MYSCIVVEGGVVCIGCSVGAVLVAQGYFGIVGESCLVGCFVFYDHGVEHVAVVVGPCQSGAAAALYVGYAEACGFGVDHGWYVFVGCVVAKA